MAKVIELNRFTSNKPEIRGSRVNENGHIKYLLRVEDPLDEVLATVHNLAEDARMHPEDERRDERRRLS